MAIIGFGRCAAIAVGAVLVVGCGGGRDTAEKSALPERPRTIAAQDPVVDKVIGITVDHSDRDFQALFEQWRGLGINTVFTGEELTASGGFRALARKNEVDLFVRFPVFSSPRELAADPELAAVTETGEPAQSGSLEFACPSRSDFRDNRIERARDVVRRLRPDGIMLEDVHQFVDWEEVGLDDDPTARPETCFCVHCLQGFATYLGVPHSSIPPETQRAARWITSNAADRWRRFRVETITATVVDFGAAIRDIDPDIVIVVAVVPWRRDDFGGAGVRVTGQDLPELARVTDVFVPMTAALMLSRPPDWIESVVRDLDWATGRPVLPTIRVSVENAASGSYSLTEFETVLRTALEDPSAGVVMQSWDDLESDSERAQILRLVVSGQ